MSSLKVACELPPAAPRGPVGISVYAAFVHELLRGGGEVEVVEAGQADATLSLDGRFRARRGQVTVTAVYDLGHLFERDAYSPLAWIRQNWQVASAARRSDHLLAPSRAVGDGLERYLGVAPDRITVLEPLPRPLFRRSSRQEALQLAQRLALPPRYFLFIGSRSRRKNLPLLAEAWALAGQRLGPGVGLVLAGPGSGPVPGGLDLGFVDEAVLPHLLSGAVAWLCPSLYEGCAVGALEAMACGVPALVSGTGALPRTVDRAGLILDPHDPGQWADAMVAIAGREGLRSSLSAAARKGIAERRAHPPDLAPLLAGLRGQGAPSAAMASPPRGR